jgi:hypothetical protein
LEAGYAADGYARLRQIGVVSVSYGVGTLCLVNAVAGSLAEKIPLVVVNGGPSERELWVERNQGVLFSHSTGRARAGGRAPVACQSGERLRDRLEPAVADNHQRALVRQRVADPHRGAHRIPDGKPHRLSDVPRRPRDAQVRRRVRS